MLGNSFSEEEIIAKKSINSVAWNFIAVAVKVFLNFFRIYFLARLISEETFGIYGYINSIFIILMSFRSFGTDAGYLNRSKYTADNEIALQNYFSLNLVLTSIWIVVCSVISIYVINYDNPVEVYAFFFILFVYALRVFNQPHYIKLVREINNKKLAQINIFGNFLELFLSMYLAFSGYQIWALIATNFSFIFSRIILLNFIDKTWKLRFRWDKDIIRHYLNFGKTVTGANLLASFLDRLDDLWTKIYLGNYFAGLYTMAHSFSRYPFRIINGPLEAVSAGSFSALSESKYFIEDAFKKSTSYIFRLGFFVGGGLISVSTEFISVMLGDKWLPMEEIFIFLVIYTLLKPVMSVFRSFFVAIGKPKYMLHGNFVQVVVLGIGLFVFGSNFGVNGVAFSVNLSIIVGIIFLQGKSKKTMQVNLINIIKIPVFIFLVSFYIVQIVNFSVIGDSLLLVGLLKIAVYSIVFIIMMIIFDRDQILEIKRVFQKYLFK